MKRLLRYLFRIKTKQVQTKKENLRLGVDTMQKIHSWEKAKGEVTIRSSFNRDLYYKYLKEITK